MSRPVIFVLAILTVVATMLAAVVHNYTTAATKREGLRAFAGMMQVIRHPRCLNCHHPGQPPVRDGRRAHVPRINIGNDGFGIGGHRCAICHREQNNELTRIPGAFGWRKPPHVMTWAGLSNADICENLKDRETNGDRDLAELLHHLEHDHLIIWAWTPGKVRQPPPSTHASFVENARNWIAARSPCPPSTVD